MTDPGLDFRTLGPSTIAVHAGDPNRTPGGPVVNPITQTTSFFSEPDGGAPVRYTRYSNNPNQQSVEARIAALEAAEACVVTSSGTGAMVAALLTFLSPGDHVLAAKVLYGGTRSVLDGELGRLGIRTTYVDFSADGWADAIEPATRVLLIETLSNPLLRFTDPATLAPVAERAGAALLVDSTFTPPTNLRALASGATLSIHSATKYLGGHSDVTAGCVSGAAGLVADVRARVVNLGTALDPNSAWLLERGLKTLGVRMERHNRNGLAVASWLAERSEVARVHYPGLQDDASHAEASARMNGFGGMVSVVLHGGGEAAARFVRRLRLAKVAPSLGGVDTLVSEPRFTSHVGLSPAEREAQGIPDGLIRVSLGIEDATDLIADFEQALATAR